MTRLRAMMLMASVMAGAWATPGFASQSPSAPLMLAQDQVERPY